MTETPKPYKAGFILPKLPKEWYMSLKDQTVKYGLTQWQVFILSLTALEELQRRDPEAAQTAASIVKTEYNIVRKADRKPKPGHPGTPIPGSDFVVQETKS